MAKAIMIQGTMSNVGKSLLAAGLCRIFAQDGYRTAPFKSQNMALNSYITREGLEMGRAQAVQAEAAGILPAADMNPILLKPTTDVGSQVIVNGVPIGNMKAREYFSYKKELIPAIKAAYGRLAAAYDIIVIEGAGSPAEINLNQEDIVNMGMAAMAQAPVLLAGDIDRGGVFAQLYGTVSLLKEEERRRVKGIIINKFRGDKTILEPGIKMLEELCGLPVLGAVPYMDVDLEDEDSLGDGLLGPKKGGGLIDIAVIRFPRISNFTDFNVFSAMEEVNLRYVKKAGELGNPDLVILPGTKNTISDLLWLRQSGLEAAILKLAGRQTPVWGICGGYQMLGEELLDPEGSESGQAGMRAAGMGLLPAVTVFQADKVRTQAEGSFGELDGVFKGLSGHPVKGYEIHMGRTSLKEGLRLEDTARRVDYRLEPEICRPLSWLIETQSGSKRAKQDGLNRGNVCGTYLHGVFDGEGVARRVAELLAEKKGVKLCGFQEMDYRAYRQRQYDRLAEGLRESLDMGEIYRIMGL